MDDDDDEWNKVGDVVGLDWFDNIWDDTDNDALTLEKVGDDASQNTPGGPTRNNPNFLPINIGRPQKLIVVKKPKGNPIHNKTSNTKDVTSEVEINEFSEQCVNELDEIYIEAEDDEDRVQGEPFSAGIEGNIPYQIGRV